MLAPLLDGGTPGSKLSSAVAADVDMRLGIALRPHFLSLPPVRALPAAEANLSAGEAASAPNAGPFLFASHQSAPEI